MLDHLYAKFDKAYFAGLCKTIAAGENINTYYMKSISVKHALLEFLALFEFWLLQNFFP